MSDKTNFQQIVDKVKQMGVGNTIKLTFSQAMEEVDWVIFLRDLIVQSGCDIEGLHTATEALITKKT